MALLCISSGLYDVEKDDIRDYYREERGSEALYEVLDALASLAINRPMRPDDLEAIVAVEQATLSDGTSGERLITLKDLLDVPVGIREAGVVALWSQGFSSKSAIQFMNLYYEGIGFNSVAEYYKLLGGALVKIASKPQGGAMLAILETSSTLVVDKLRSFDASRPGDYTISDELKHMAQTLKLQDWHARAIIGYLAGKSIKEIAEQERKGSTAVVRALDRAVQRLGKMPEAQQPSFLPILAKKRSQTTHGGYREYERKKKPLPEWYIEAAEAYALGVTISEIAGNLNKPTSLVERTLDKVVAHYEEWLAEERPLFYAEVARRRKVKTHGGDRGGNRYARWKPRE